MAFRWLPSRSAALSPLLVARSDAGDRAADNLRRWIQRGVGRLPRREAPGELYNGVAARAIYAFDASDRDELSSPLHPGPEGRRRRRRGSQPRWQRDDPQGRHDAPRAPWRSKPGEQQQQQAFGGRSGGRESYI